jgi:two-component system chemotaxis sensor kinase CheA
VGLDVVKANVEGLRGTVDVTSTPGTGTTFTLCLPLTLAITDGMLLACGDERFILPTMSIVAAVRPAAADLGTVARRGETFRFRDHLLLTPALRGRPL